MAAAQIALDHNLSDSDAPFTFDLYSTKVPLVNAESENWQKAIGGHDIWGIGSVTYDPSCGSFSLDITVKAEDYYNFNKGQHDIATGLPDDDNGRFAVFGWAKPFYSKGPLVRHVEWTKGEAHFDKAHSSWNDYRGHTGAH